MRVSPWPSLMLAGKNSYAPRLHGPPRATIGDVPSARCSSAIIKSQAATMTDKAEDTQTLLVYLVWDVISVPWISKGTEKPQGHPHQTAEIDPHMLRNWPHPYPEICIVTGGSRILPSFLVECLGSWTDERLPVHLLGRDLQSPKTESWGAETNGVGPNSVLTRPLWRGPGRRWCMGRTRRSRDVGLVEGERW